MEKKKKWIIGIVVVLGLAAIGSFLPDTQTEDTQQQKEVAAEKKEPSLTKDKLKEKLDGYETMYNNYVEGLQKVSDENNIEEMKTIFSETKDASQSVFSLLHDLKGEYDAESNEYKAIAELQTAFNSLKDACKDGSEYIEKNDSKYLDKYENNIKQSAIFIERYTDAKSNI